MSRIPLFFGLDDVYNDPWYWNTAPRRHQHPHFGLDISPAELQEILIIPADSQRQVLAEIRRERPADSTGGSIFPSGKDDFQVCTEVAHFKPHEISIKHFNNEGFIEGKHEDSVEHNGFISRQFIRCKKNFYARRAKKGNLNTVSSTLSSDRAFNVEAPDDEFQG